MDYYLLKFLENESLWLSLRGKYIFFKFILFRTGLTLTDIKFLGRLYFF